MCVFYSLFRVPRSFLEKNGAVFSVFGKHFCVHSSKITQKKQTNICAELAIWRKRRYNISEDKKAKNGEDYALLIHIKAL